jgi:hypothetical protein
MTCGDAVNHHKDNIIVYAHRAPAQVTIAPARLARSANALESPLKPVPRSGLHHGPGILPGQVAMI